ncbi:hypothetical protein CEUSTIGMA_g2559.t1 [Chlamydomonas eustigma]|uniref:Uncharacterized protein n=1 Tax=Chlamydomonas eustigma TaxID=1157962 RepID=A0A250WWE6_9CHLO|nr:hypothetical protein CEUSTIGMA_g2559.t1 [Chlamydomonas eustigma]|eukprot:GAX75115.1 hypothetical protein CEUSTIGMA_g2559.t1 [Chlamydomonas eustigma]
MLLLSMMQISNRQSRQVETNQADALTDRSNNRDGKLRWLFTSTSKECSELARSRGLKVLPDDILLPSPTTSHKDTAKGQDQKYVQVSEVPQDCRGTEISIGETCLTPAHDVGDEIIKVRGALDDDEAVLMVHLDLMDLVTNGQLQVSPEGKRAIDPASGLCSHISLRAMAWLDSLTECLLQNQVIRQSTLLTLLLSSQGGPALYSGPADGIKMAAGQLEGMQRAAEAAGMAVTVEARGSLPVLPQEVTMPGGRMLDPGAVVMTPQSAMMAMVSSSGAATAFGSMVDVPCPLVKRPLQTWQMMMRGVAAGDDAAGTNKSGAKGDRPASIGVVVEAPTSVVLMAQRLPGVIRRDRCERLSFEEAKARSGSGCLSTHQFMNELTAKLQRFCN